MLFLQSLNFSRKFFEVHFKGLKFCVDYCMSTSIILHSSQPAFRTESLVSTNNCLIPFRFEIFVFVSFEVRKHSVFSKHLLLFLSSDTGFALWELKLFIANRTASFLASDCLAVKEVGGAVFVPNLVVLAERTVLNLFIRSCFFNSNIQLNWIY